MEPNKPTPADRAPMGAPTPAESPIANETPIHHNVPAGPAVPPVVIPELAADEQGRPKPAAKKEPRNWRSTIGTVLLFLLAPLIAYLISAFVLQSYQVDGASMESTLHNGDRLIVNKLPRSFAKLHGSHYIPERGKIVILNANEAYYDKQLIKRVVGLPGEHITVKKGKITIYNTANPKGFDPDKSGIYPDPGQPTEGDVDITIGPNEVFVFGDNRGNSTDSREIGPINVDNIVGDLAIRLLPLGQKHNF